MKDKIDYKTLLFEIIEEPEINNKFNFDEFNINPKNLDPVQKILYELMYQINAYSEIAENIETPDLMTIYIDDLYDEEDNN